MMNNLFEYSKLVKKEAEELLGKYNLIETISKYGEVNFTGSYALDLMYKKDIDISLINDNLAVEEFTQLGKELIDKLNTPSVYFRNTRIKAVEKRPEDGLYWGINTGDWWIDIWAMRRDVYSRSEKYIKDINAKLNETNREIILKLKSELINTNRYGVEFGSRELYDAVLNNAVTTSNEFNNYLKNLSPTNDYR